jgi:hypothetical protein
LIPGEKTVVLPAEPDGVKTPMVSTEVVPEFVPIAAVGYPVPHALDWVA